MRYETELRKAADHVRSMGYSPVYIALYGSQNYGLSINLPGYRSDLDFKCVVLTSLRDLVEGRKPVSVTVDTEDGQIDIKDIRVMMEAVGKMNPAYLECLATVHCLILDGGACFVQIKTCLLQLLAERGAVFARACLGLFLQKEKQLCHPFPAAMEKIQAYGYDGKQAHHMYRLLLMLRDFAQSGEMRLIPPEGARELLMDLKLGRIPLEEARALIDGWKTEMQALAARIEEDHGEAGKAAQEALIRLAQAAMLEHCRREAVESKG